MSSGRHDEREEQSFTEAVQFGDETGPPPVVLQIGDKYQVQGTRRAKAGRGECTVRIPEPSARAGSKIERWREIFLERRW